MPRELPHVTVTGSSDSSMTVTWELMTPDMARGVITTYKLMYRQHGHATQHIIELPAPARGYTITGMLLVTEESSKSLTAHNFLFKIFIFF